MSDCNGINTIAWFAKMIRKMYARLLLAGFILLSHLNVSADQYSSVSPNNSRDSDHIELSLLFGFGSFPLIGFNSANTLGESEDDAFYFDFVIEGRVQHKKYFLELSRQSLDTYALGYSLYDNDQGSFELLAARLFSEITRGHVDGFRLVEPREADINLGFRHSRYLDDSILQTEIGTNFSSEHFGYVGSVQLGHQKQFGNWRWHGLLGMRYFSDGVLNQYFSVSPNENAGIGEYIASDGFMASFQLGASYPLSEKFVFNVNFEFDEFPRAISKSPLAQGSSRFDANIGITYIVGGE